MTYKRYWERNGTRRPFPPQITGGRMKDPTKINVLVACEESQRVCMAFRERGFNAFSCDIQECSGGHPEYHILGIAANSAEKQRKRRARQGRATELNS